jgi:hypothetical protein
MPTDCSTTEIDAGFWEAEGTAGALLVKSAIDWDETAAQVLSLTTSRLSCSPIREAHLADMVLFRLGRHFGLGRHDRWCVQSIPHLLLAFTQPLASLFPSLLGFPVTGISGLVR